jgi:hypothetical protein
MRSGRPRGQGCPGLGSHPVRMGSQSEGIISTASCHQIPEGGEQLPIHQVLDRAIQTSLHLQRAETGQSRLACSSSLPRTFGRVTIYCFTADA